MINKCKISLCCCIVLGTGCGPKSTGPSTDTGASQDECDITVRSQGISDLYADVRQAVVQNIDTLKLYCRIDEISNLDIPNGNSSALPLSTSSKGRHAKMYAGDVLACKVYGQNPDAHGGHLIVWTAQKTENQICLTEHHIVVSTTEPKIITKSPFKLI